MLEAIQALNAIELLDNVSISLTNSGSHQSPCDFSFRLSAMNSNMWGVPVFSDSRLIATISPYFNNSLGRNCFFVVGL